MSDYLNSVKKRFEGYKKLGEAPFAQISDEGLFWQYNAESNSIATRWLRAVVKLFLHHGCNLKQGNEGSQQLPDI